MNKQSQKDTGARWTRKDVKNFFGYTNHVNNAMTSIKE